MDKYDLGIVGLGVMGQNLSLNFSDNGFSLVVFDNNKESLKNFVRETCDNKKIIGANTLTNLVQQLAIPRKIMLMVPAGKPVDDVIQHLIPLLDDEDIIIDGGNSHFPDTVRRVQTLQKQNIYYIGTGVSGGEEGARYGPSLMPGGNKKAWDSVKPLLQSIAAHVDGEPCCQWIGDGGAGHYVKMVHNGIEYGDMQLIAEVYQLMHQGLGLSHQEMQDVFIEWNKGVLNSYLIEITANIMGQLDEDKKPLLTKILDCAGQKGTGKWTAINALEEGIPLTLISEAVFARFLSSLKTSRQKASQYFPLHSQPFSGDKETVLKNLHDALYASKIISYAQGFMLMQQASQTNKWDLDFGNIALTWRGGCIIRSRFLNNIKQAYSNNPKLENLLFDDFFMEAIKHSQQGWRKLAIQAIKMEVPIPAFSAALSFFDSYRSETSSANLIQAQRDYFGAHTYERVDQTRGVKFHTDWVRESN